MIPRLRARVGEVEDPPEYKGQFCFEVFLTWPGEGEGRKLGDWGPFKTEKLAKQKMREMVKEMSQLVEKEMTGDNSGQYLDMKTNEIRSWDEN